MLCSVKRNTAYLVGFRLVLAGLVAGTMVIVWSAGGGGFAWWVRLRCQLDIFRLITRGVGASAPRGQEVAQDLVTGAG